MTPPLAIRPIQGRSEIEACARMMAESEPWITLQRGYNASLQALSSPEKEIHVAVQGGAVIGFIMLNLHGGFVGYLQSICVAPEWRNQGIGRMLIDFSEARVFKNHPNMFICVSSFNAGAQRLYRSLGYEVVGELKNYIVDGYSEILLRKSIASLTAFTKSTTPPALQS
jgi:[ribosomal protein S18]-alanine N-acetyltransferase